MADAARQTRSHLGVDPHLRAGHAVTSLTDNTAGTASDTLGALSGTYTPAELRDNQASLAAKIEEILDVLREAGLIDT